VADRGVLSVDRGGLESVVAMVNEGLVKEEVVKEGLGGGRSTVEWSGEVRRRRRRTERVAGDRRGQPSCLLAREGNQDLGSRMGG
jgi:hypothetical protein